MKKIQAILPRENIGHQFVVFADSCAGVPDQINSNNLADVCNSIKKIDPLPEFICFPGDEIEGLTNDERKLNQQWDHWLNREMSWIKKFDIPLYNTTGNHTTYNAMSENVFRNVFNHPGNGPKGQEGLSYYIKKENLLMIFVNTMWSGLGEEGRVETAWLDKTLETYRDFKNKIVFGHHPVFPVNGFFGDFQRILNPEDGEKFWNLLIKHNVFAYICSHILAFDVQVHYGILQILTAGAGTNTRMPEGFEYFHFLQAALDDEGIRYQVIDRETNIREWLSWPFEIDRSKKWHFLCSEDNVIKCKNWKKNSIHNIFIFEFSGRTPDKAIASLQNLLCGYRSKEDLPVIWIGLTGLEQQVTIYLRPKAGRSPHHWYGPKIGINTEFKLQLGIHNGMGPGGIMWKWHENDSWSSCSSASPWGAERLEWPENWSMGNSQLSADGKMEFKGENLKIRYLNMSINFQDII